MTAPTRHRPAQALEPYRPGIDGPFGPAEAGHLLRRAAFGGTLAERRRIETEGPSAAVRRLTTAPPRSEEYERTLELISVLDSVDELDTAQSLWLTRMLRTPYPFGENLALFWHGHFATSIDKVARLPLMSAQVETLRRLGDGRLEPLVMAVSRDPAMIVWLDGNANRRHQANENYARELFELFTLGIGHYGEDDVRDAARAFTGWHERRGAFHFNPHEHDDGSKAVLGRQGALDGDDVVQACLAQPACARFVAGKLYRFFVRPAPEAELLDELAERYRASDYDTGALIRTLLSSRDFFAAESRRALVKSPTQLAVGAARSLGLQLDAKKLAARLQSLGQSLYAPPSVKGWDGGRAWLNAATLVGRINLAADLAVGQGRLVAGRTPETPPSLDEALDLLLEDDVPDDVRNQLEQHALRRGDDEGLLQAVLALPEYQLA